MTCTIRDAQLEDAAALIAYIKTMLAEPGINMPLEPGEFAFTLEQERDILRAALENPRARFLIALDEDGVICGELSLHGSSRRALQHGVELGMSVRQDRRGQGIGSVLLAEGIQWARTGGLIRRIQLHVYARNAPAIALYRRFGFVEEGRRRAAILEDGVYLDDLIMALLW